MISMTFIIVFACGFALLVALIDDEDHNKT